MFLTLPPSPSLKSPKSHFPLLARLRTPSCCTHLSVVGCLTCLGAGPGRCSHAPSEGVSKPVCSIKFSRKFSVDKIRKTPPSSGYRKLRQGGSLVRNASSVCRVGRRQHSLLRRSNISSSLSQYSVIPLKVCIFCQISVLFFFFSASIIK